MSNMPAPVGKSSHVDHAIQVAQETPGEVSSRKTADFSKIEHDLNFKRFSNFELGIIDKATGLLGTRNPFGKKARAKDNEVWILDNTAYMQAAPNTGSPNWEAEFVVCYFQKGRKDITEFVSHIVDAIGIDGEVGIQDGVRDLIAQRLQPFISPIAPARMIRVSIPCNAGPPHSRTLGPSNANGISSQIIMVGGDTSANDSTITVTTDGPEYPPASCKTRFAGPEGWAIISDIDDTIKVTMTPDPKGILTTTFTQEAKVTEGMPEFYKLLEAQFGKPAWFYLSASPYNLYPFLHKFINDYYLPGTIILRDASWMYFGGILQSLTQGTQAYKTSRIEKIQSWLPKRKFICIGDSTQSDPESYAEMFVKYPGWIKAIYIRRVVDAPNMEEKNKDERFEKAFKDVPAHIWRVFTTPDELADHVKHLVGEAHLGVTGA